MSIRSGQMMKKNLSTGFFLNKQKLFFYALFLTSPVAMATAHTLQKNARINSSVVNLTLTKNGRQSINSLKVMMN